MPAPQIVLGMIAMSMSVGDRMGAFLQEPSFFLPPMLGIFLAGYVFRLAEKFFENQADHG